MLRIILYFLPIFIALTIKLSYDPKKGYHYTIQGDTPEEVIDAEVKIKNYIRKGILPKKEEKTK